MLVVVEMVIMVVVVNGDGGGGGGGGDDIKVGPHRAAGGLLTSGKKQPGQLHNLKIGQRSKQ